MDSVNNGAALLFQRTKAVPITSGAVLAAGSLSGHGTARAGIPLGVSHVKVRYHGDPEHRAVLKSSHPTKYAAPPGWFARMTGALESTWETTKEGADWTWGMLKGDFNEDPTIAQTITNAIITAIPIVDQVGDVRDISANVKLLVWDKRFKEFGVWLALFFTLLGLIPTVGSLLKGVLKLVWKSARLDKILALFNHFIKGNGVKWLKELKAGKLKTYVKEAAAKGHELLYSAIAKLSIIEQLIPARFKTLQAKADDLHNTLRNVKAMINDQFSRIGEELLEKLDNILAEQSDEFEQGASKSTLKKQQRAEAPEDELSSKGTDSIDDSSKKAYDDNVDKDGPKTTGLSKSEKADVRKWADDLADSNPNKMTPDEIAADLEDFARRKKKVDDLYEAAMKNPDILPKGITTDQLRLAVKGDPVTGQRVPLNFSVKNGKLSTDINQAKKQFADFQADLKKILDEEGIADAKVVQLGSGTTGWSTAPGKTGKPWSPQSDVDFAIFSDEALAQAKKQGAGINPKNTQAGKYTTIKNEVPGGKGFHDTSLGKKLFDLERKWNEKIYGDRYIDGLDFKLNLQTDKPFTSAVPVI